MRSVFVALALALALTTGPAALDPLAANSNANRVLSLYNIHNKERITVTYKRDGAYLPDGLKKLNWFMRDWRRNEATKMDPKLLDIIWEMHSELGSSKPVHLISGYRSRKTNSGLRKSRGGQAKNSRHIVGKAADIHFPDVPVRRLRYSALVKERGGVGYYPTSALPFVHVDTGRVRHWPRIGLDELALLTKGRSKHIPRGGRKVTRADYTRARAKNTKLAQRIAAFYAERRRPGAVGAPTTAVASLDQTAPKNWSIPKARVAVRPKAPVKRIQTAALTPAKKPIVASIPQPTAARRLATTPDVRVDNDLFAALDRDNAPPSRDPTRRALPKPILPDVASIGEVATASLATVPAGASAPVSMPLSALLSARLPVPVPDRRPQASVQVASLSAGDALNILRPARTPPSSPFFELSGWASAPDYDDDHDGELSYRPFPIGPFLTENPSIDDAAMAQLVHPDLAGTRDLVGRDDGVVPLRFKPGLQYAEMLWSDIFTTEGGVALLSGDPALRGERQQVAQQ